MHGARRGHCGGVVPGVLLCVPDQDLVQSAVQRGSSSDLPVLITPAAELLPHTSHRRSSKQQARARSCSNTWPRCVGQLWSSTTDSDGVSALLAERDSLKTS